jgi:hypothetical protein
MNKRKPDGSNAGLALLLGESLRMEAGVHPTRLNDTPLSCRLEADFSAEFEEKFSERSSLSVLTRVIKEAMALVETVAE